MKVLFKTTELEHYYITPLDELKGKLPFQKDVIKQFKKKVQLLLSITSIDELKLFNSLNLEKLKGDLTGQFSIRLNKQYRLIFQTLDESIGEVVLEIVLVNEISKHYEK